MNEELRNLIAEKDFTRLENSWMEMMEDGSTPPAEFFAVCQELKKAQANDQARLLLEVLAVNYETAGDLKRALEVYRQMVFYTHELNEIRKKIIGLYRRIYEKSDHIEEYIAMSNLEEEEQLPRALEKMEEYLGYDIGRFFYFDRYGLGEVVEINARKKEVVINFEKKERHFLTFDVAKGLLRPVTEGHFLYKKYKDPVAVKTMAAEDPAGLVSFLLRDFDQPLSPGQIKLYLTGVFTEDEAQRVWDKAKKKLETCANVRIAGKAQKTYQYIETGFDRTADALTAFNQADPRERFRLADEYSRKKPEVFRMVLEPLVKEAKNALKKDPPLALDIYLLCRDQNATAGFDFDPETIFKAARPQDLIAGMDNLEHQKFMVRIIKEKNPETWPRILKDLMLNLEAFPVLYELEAELRPYPEMLQDVYHSIITLPGHYSKPFPWFLKKLSEGELAEYWTTTYLAKIIAGLEFVKSQKTVMKKIMSLESFDAFIKDATDDDVQRIMNALKSSKAFAEYEKKDFFRIVEHYFPHFFIKVEDVIYATEEALRRKKEELAKILSVEIPLNKKDISRAREFGDLSENAEYKAAKEKQDQLYQKLKTLEAELPKVRIIDPAQADADRVSVGTRVTIKSAASGEETSYAILGRWDTDLERNVISNEAPTAQHLLRKTAGEKVVLNGVEYEIVKIEKIVR